MYAVPELNNKSYSKTIIETLLATGGAIALGALIWANIGDGIAKKDVCFSPKGKSCKVDTIGSIPASFWDINKSKTANPDYNPYALLESKHIKIVRDVQPDNPLKIELGLLGMVLGAGVLTGSEKLKDQLETERPHYRAAKKLENIRANIGLKIAEELLTYSAIELIKHLKCLKSADAKRELVLNISPQQQTLLLMSISREEYHEYGYLLDMGRSFDKFGEPMLTAPKVEAIAQTTNEDPNWIKGFLSSTCLTWGNQGSGKSWFVRYLAKAKADAGYKVIVFDPNSNKYEWQGVELYNDYADIQEKMRWYVDEVMARYSEFGKSNISEEEWRKRLWEQGKAVTIICEEMSTYGDFIEDKELLEKFVKVATTLSRKQEMPAILVAHNNTQTCLGNIKGLANMIARMQQIQLLATTDPATNQPVASGFALTKLDGSDEWVRVTVPKMTEKIRNFAKVETQTEPQTVPVPLDLEAVKQQLEKSLSLPIDEPTVGAPSMSENAIALLNFLIRTEKLAATVAEIQPCFKINGERFKVGELRAWMQEICDAGKGKWEDGRLILSQNFGE